MHCFEGNAHCFALFCLWYHYTAKAVRNRSIPASCGFCIARLRQGNTHLLTQQPECTSRAILILLSVALLRPASRRGCWMNIGHKNSTIKKCMATVSQADTFPSVQ
nr:MAG TPA: hypothetical protein [Bacteriophage sp.]